MSNVDSISHPITHSHLFEQLAGTWQLKRHIHSTCPALPSGIFVGTATFVAQPSTASGYQQEYSYQEGGFFSAAQQTGLYSEQRYIYRLHAQLDQISVWTTHPNNQVAHECLQRLDAIIEQPNTIPNHHHYRLQATAHQCKRDHYQADHQFYCIDERLDHWLSTYVVKGPKKDYRIESHYTRVHLNAEKANAFDDKHHYPVGNDQRTRLTEVGSGILDLSPHFLSCNLSCLRQFA